MAWPSCDIWGTPEKILYSNALIVFPSYYYFRRVILSGDMVVYVKTLTVVSAGCVAIHRFQITNSARCVSTYATTYALSWAMLSRR